MKTLKEVLFLSADHLEKHGAARARRDAEDLLAHVLGIQRLDLYLQIDRPLEEKELPAFRDMIRRRAKGEPVQYILGEVPFYGCHFTVGPDVLIPRPETEILLDKISNEIEPEEKTVWDLCTGSGCLGISLKKKFPHLKVFLSDMSSEALKIAQKNKESNEVDATLLQGDLLAPFKGQKADIIICNPPYVSEGEYAHLDPSVRDYEPKMALVGGRTGLEFYQRLANELPAFLNPRGKVFLEIGSGQGKAVQDLFQENCWIVKRLEKDWAGHDRFFFLEFQ